MKVGIIGGGPGGSVTAATLARHGHEVQVFEMEIFPRFHIGESLLPTNMPIYEELGITREVLRQHSYMPKTAAHFEHTATGRIVRFVFADAMPGDPPSIFQVERSRFDKLLLDTAVAKGAKLRCPVKVSRVDLEQRVIHHSAGSDQFDFIVDASGRETLLGRQLGIVDLEGDLKRAAVFGHVGHLPFAPGAQRGDITINKSEAGWCWQIPLEDAKWSVGLVLKREMVVKGGTPADVFRNNLKFFPQVAERMKGVIPDPVRSIPNISYRVRERIGRRYALLGDAGGFIDPIFSSGVLLATRAGWRLGEVLHKAGPDADLKEWKAQTDHDLATFFAFIRLWYDGHFVDNLFFAENKEDSICRGIVSLLAGNTTHPQNVFLKMLAKRAQAQEAKTMMDLKTI
jgi:FADH2-dependent halogenase